MPGSEFVTPAGRVQVCFKPRKHERFLDVTSLVGIPVEPKRSAPISSEPLLNLDALSVELIALAEAARVQHEQSRCGVGVLLDEGLAALSDQGMAEQIRASIRAVTGTPLAGDPHLDCAAANSAYYQILAMIH